MQYDLEKLISKKTDLPEYVDTILTIANDAIRTDKLEEGSGDQLIREKGYDPEHFFPLVLKMAQLKEKTPKKEQLQITGLEGLYGALSGLSGVGDPRYLESTAAQTGNIIGELASWIAPQKAIATKLAAVGGKNLLKKGMQEIGEKIGKKVLGKVGKVIEKEAKEKITKPGIVKEILLTEKKIPFGAGKVFKKVKPENIAEWGLAGGLAQTLKSGVRKIDEKLQINEIADKIWKHLFGEKEKKHVPVDTQLFEGR